MADPDFSYSLGHSGTHPMPVTLRRLLELKINRNRVLLSAVLCTSIVTLASGSPGQRPGSPGLGSAIEHGGISVELAESETRRGSSACTRS